jgi:hypothetical protein
MRLPFWFIQFQQFKKEALMNLFFFFNGKYRSFWAGVLCDPRIEVFFVLYKARGGAVIIALWPSFTL